jgi:hypothetical protein
VSTSADGDEAKTKADPVPSALDAAVTDMRKRRPAPNSKTRVAVVLGALAFILLALAAMFLINLQQNAKRDDQIAKLATSNEGQKQATDKANDRLQQAGLPTVAAPEQVTPTVGPGSRGQAGVPGANGVDGAPGPVGPGGQPGRNGSSGADGSDGVNGDMGVPGQTGAVGKDGSPGKDGEAGSDGAPGNAGPPGADGTGEQGPPGADGQNGENGQDGRDGADGAPGRGVVSVACTTDGRLIVTYTDDTSTDSGACPTAQPSDDPTEPPDPDPTPTPSDTDTPS